MASKPPTPLQSRILSEMRNKIARTAVSVLAEFF